MLARLGRTRSTLLLGLLAIAIGVAGAVRFAWTADDAYISFRYARNLVNGLGLVYNAGERVEGYSNFLWTLWCAVGLRFGFAAETWANASGIACFAATIGLLAWLTARRAGAGGAWAFPLAACALAVERDAWVFATSGLETAAFTLLAVAGYAALVPIGGTGSPERANDRRAALAALALGMATLTRPDGAVFAVTGGVWVACVARSRLRTTMAYGAVLAVILGAYAAWKLQVFGALLPNTYYAKSAGVAWWDQGLAYVALYLRKVPVLAVGPLLATGLAVWEWRRGRSAESREREPSASRLAPEALLAVAFAAAHTASVARVGGDFMFARFMIPATPFLGVALELALSMLAMRLGAGRSWVPAALAGVALATIAFAPDPLRGRDSVRGIVDERAYYRDAERAERPRMAADLRELARDLPLRIVISGGQAIVGYVSDVPVVIEASTGLTDSFIAHQPLVARGRVGHEKAAPIPYLIERRRAHLEIGQSRIFSDTLGAYVPVLLLEYKSVRATLLTWDPPIMAELRRRGARFDDFPALLDDVIARSPGLPDSVVALVYTQARRFYFDGASDPAREAAFTARLRGASARAADKPGAHESMRTVPGDSFVHSR